MTEAWDSTRPPDTRLGRKVRAWTAVLLAVASSGCSSGSGTDNPLVEIAIGPTSLQVVDGGSTAQLTATGTYDDGTTRDLTSSVTWTTSDSAVASVDASGLLHAGWAGPVTVTAAASKIHNTAVLRVAGFAPLAVTRLDAPTAGYLDSPVAVLDGRGAVLVAYGINAPSERALVTCAAGPVWPPAWVEHDDGIHDAWLTSAADVQLATNAAGIAGMLYRRTTDGLNASRSSFGIAHHDGTAWTWTEPWQGSIDNSLSANAAALAVDAAGALFVAYQSTTDTYPLDELSVARFDASGFVDVTSWSEYVTQVYVAVSPSGKVMVLNEWTGSRLFDGASWGPLQALPQRIGPGARLVLEDDGTGTLFALHSQVLVLRNDGAGWSQPEKLSGTASVYGGSVAMDASGHAVAAWAAPGAGGDEVVARVFDGTSWGAAQVLDAPPQPDGCCGASLSKVDVLTDGAGRFVVLWYQGYMQRAAWYDGQWHAAIDLAPGGVFVPQAVMRPDGQFVVVSDRDTYNALYASTYAFEP